MNSWILPIVSWDQLIESWRDWRDRKHVLEAAAEKQILLRVRCNIAPLPLPDDVALMLLEKMAA